MQTLIHDCEEQNLSLDLTKDIKVISGDSSIHNCIGCFGCWVKTPGACVIRDNYGDMGELISKSEELIIISKCYYGGFSPFVKNVLDRSISYIHPYFTFRNGEMHHKSRYKNQLKLRAYFYGDITEDEKETARKLIQANGINLNCNDHEVIFLQSASELEDLSL